jgi:two-component system, LytTR family, response regulator
MKPFDCIIVDDDEMDRLLVVSYAKRFDSLNIVGVFESAEQALKFLENNTVDVAFLDIELQKASGMELRKQASNIPVCVFISSHSELAAETFELITLDFIAKPYKLDRFTQTVNRIVEYMEIRHKANLFEASIGGDVVYIKTGTEKIKVKMHEILYLEALKNYTLIITETKRHCVLTSLGDLLTEVSFSSFVRIHRSFAVQKQYVQKIGANEVQLHNKTMVPLGRSYKDNLNFVL